ncbi:hypothetical protein DUNSADRAFT_4674, partial [Dunaliella salina]
MASYQMLKSLDTQSCGAPIRKVRQEYRPQATLPTLHTTSCLATCKLSNQPFKRGHLLARSVESNSQQESISEVSPHEHDVQAEGDGVESAAPGGGRARENKPKGKQEGQAQQTAEGPSAEEVEWIESEKQKDWNGKVEPPAIGEGPPPSGVWFLAVVIVGLSAVTWQAIRLLGEFVRDRCQQ